MNYLFGRPVLPSKPQADGPRKYFIVGAYPSALHVRWLVPEHKHPIKAVAVDNEPEPFWTGHDEVERIEAWRRENELLPTWGRVGPCGPLNGSSGRWVEQKILAPLRIQRSQAWLTDCVDTYYESTSVAARFADPALVNTMLKRGIVAPNLRPHPSEDQVVREALENHRNRLRAELRKARPKVVITLGNAALRVMAALAEGARLPRNLSAAANAYGQPLRAKVDTTFEWLPLAHPASPEVYQNAHQGWIESRGKKL